MEWAVRDGLKIVLSLGRADIFPLYDDEIASVNETLLEPIRFPATPLCRSCFTYVVWLAS